MNTGRYTLRSLFLSSEIEQIIIPEIQRDYVWKENNVIGLIKSILNHFKEKATLRLEIVDQNKNASVNQDIRAFLAEEYTRMVHSTRIGFIYAYHSQDYPGKYFLIDGQQRLTTIFLLHLCAYKHAGMTADYRKFFFKEKQPKIDYKVREISHDFMVDFIENEVDQDMPFTQSHKYYSFYDDDVTTSSLIKNYVCIEEQLNKCFSESLSKESFYKELVNYIENYIEFNYFDTNISEQGERLYLYMNSRGEALSVQESIRPILISRSKHKLQAGEKWEEWQNFFWRNKGGNPNADKGFQEFLRWATFLHICTSDNPRLYNQKNNSETKQDYIRIEKRDDVRNEQQQRWIKEYQENNTSFSIDYIDSVFQTVCKLDSFNQKENYAFLKGSWLSSIENTSDYPTILACLAYLYYYPDVKELDVKRVGMFIKNCMYYDTNRKNPEMACVNVVNTLKCMYEHEISDIADLHKIAKELPKNIIIEADRHKRGCQLTMWRTKWEELFWSITNDDVFSSFLAGDTLCLFEWSEFEYDSFVKYYKSFKEKVIDIIKKGYKEEIDELHEKLLGYGDFAVRDGCGIGIPRYFMLFKEDEWTWGVNESKQIRVILKDYLDDKVPYCNGELFNLLIDNDSKNDKSVLSYLEYLELLKSETTPPHVILPRKYQISGNNYRELMTQWVHQELKGSWVYQTNVVVLEFDIQEAEGLSTVMKCKPNEAFYLDSIYEWNGGKPFWSFKISTRGREYHKNIPSIINKWDGDLIWEERMNQEKQHNEYWLEHAVPDDTSKTIHERKQAVIDFVEKIFRTLSD